MLTSTESVSVTLSIWISIRICKRFQTLFLKTLNGNRPFQYENISHHRTNIFNRKADIDNKT